MGQTLKEYADLMGLTYEAVRVSFKIHEGKDLQEGTDYVIVKRSKVLTDAGVEKMNAYRRRNKPLAVAPNDLNALNARIRELQEQIDTLTKEKEDLQAANADLQLKIVDLEQKISQRNDELISTLFRLQTAQEKLLTAAAEPAKEEPKRGLFSRLFHKRL